MKSDLSKTDFDGGLVSRDAKGQGRGNKVRNDIIPHLIELTHDLPGSLRGKVFYLGCIALVNDARTRQYRESTADSVQIGLVQV